ncbi:MAG: glycosyltransferase family A protein [Polyangiaceae bacterium]
MRRLHPEIEALRRVMTDLPESAIVDPNLRVAIVTPYCGEGADVLAQCLASVAAQTERCAHIVVGDGAVNEVVRDFDVQHIQLPQRHRDAGDTPRAIGAMSAVAQGFDAIGFLDGDNWLSPDHVATMCDLHSDTGAQVMIAARSLHRLDGTLLRAGGEARDGVDHVDTNCLFLTSAAFRMVPVWAMMPKRLHLAGDRLVWSTIQALGYQIARAEKATVHYRTGFRVHYEECGETPPEGAKDATDVRASMRWWNELPHEQRRIAFRRLGLKV